ncbi:MAG: hypothetical protein ABUK01_03775 [Leptospirales bacterium]
MSEVDGKFVYSPQFDYGNIDAQNSTEAIPALKEFDKSYLRPLENHMTSADTLRQYLSSSNVPEEIRAQVSIKIEDIDRELMQVVRMYSQVEAHLEPHELESESMHIFHALFSADELSDPKLNFVKMIKVFEYLRHFNERVFENWSHVKKIIETFRPNPSSLPFMEQVLEYKVFPRLELCEITDLLIRRLAYILKIEPDAKIDDKGFLREHYSTLLTYNLGTIYQKDLEDFIVTVNEEESDKIEVTAKEDVNSCIVDPYFLDSRGNSPFNQSYLYTLSMNEKYIQNDLEKIKKAVYIETHLSAENISLRQDMIRHFVSSASRKDNKEKYMQFLNNHFDFTYETIILHFAHFTDKEKVLMFYHMGPVFFLKIIMQFLREGKTGYIHRFMSRNNMARELPFEYIKYTLKDWWDIGIFKRCTFKERNSKEIHVKIVETFRDLWVKDQKKALQNIIQIPIIVKAYHTRDYKALRPFLQREVSFLFYILYSRFLGTDFLYLPFNKLPKELIYAPQ